MSGFGLRKDVQVVRRWAAVDGRVSRPQDNSSAGLAGPAGALHVLESDSLKH